MAGCLPPNRHGNLSPGIYRRYRQNLQCMLATENGRDYFRNKFLEAASTLDFWIDCDALINYGQRDIEELRREARALVQRANDDNNINFDHGKLGVFMMRIEHGNHNEIMEAVSDARNRAFTLLQVYHDDM